MRNLEPVSSQERLSDESDGAPQCGLTPEELELARQQPNKTVITHPPLLGYAAIVLIIVNRMVGTGIFRTPTTLIHGTHSVGYSLMFWAAGGVVAVSGAHVFAEFGLTIPRLTMDHGGEQFVPRNGGEKNYIEYFFKTPKFLATCIYGIPFVALGSMAGNALIFSDAVLGASGGDVDDWTMRGVAIGVATFACALHAFWRRGGIILNNFFGVIKLAILLTMFIIGAAYAAGAFGGNGDIARANLNSHNSTRNATSSPRGYAEAFLAILFAYGGFNQASYVLGEIEDPRRRFKPTTISTVVCISILYFLVNLSYMFVVPRTDQLSSGSDSVASFFFTAIFGNNGQKIQNSLMAFSSLGNIIVQTFTAARVKQEIAKEGILPFAKFFADNYSLTPKWLRSNSVKGSEDTPVGAILLHWIFSVILILVTAPAKDDSYGVLVNLYSYTIDALFGCMVGAGLLILRLNKSAQWSKMSTSNPWVSTVTAAIFTVANLFPLIAVWIPPSADEISTSLTKSWYITGTIGIGLVGFAVLYWIVLYHILPHVTGRQLEVDREYNYIKVHGYWIMWHEVVSFNWKSA